MTPDNLDPSIADRAHAFLIRQGGYYNAREVAAGIDCDLAEARDSLRALERAGTLASRQFLQAAAWRPGHPRLPATTEVQWRVPA